MKRASCFFNVPDVSTQVSHPATRNPKHANPEPATRTPQQSYKYGLSLLSFPMVVSGP